MFDFRLYLVQSVHQATRLPPPIKNALKLRQ